MEEHLISRNLNPDLYYHLYYTEEAVTFCLYNFNNQLVGYQRYKPNSPKKSKNPKEARYFTRKGNIESVTLWGNEFKTNSPLVFIVEGVFKASALHKLGYQAWAVLTSTMNETTKQQLKLLNNVYVGIGDNDKAGMKLANQFKYHLVLDDIDEMKTEELKLLIENMLKSFNLENFIV